MRRSTPLSHWLPFGLLTASMAIVVTCNGPAPIEPLNSRMTEARHTAQEFPIDHGASENPLADCAPCHGGLPSFSMFTCLTCHYHEQSTTDAAHGSVGAYSYDSLQCYACHPSGDAMDRDSHTPYFPIAPGTNHESVGCEQCHTGASYSEYTCIDCHEHAKEKMDPEHSGVTGYVYASSSCLSCHPTGEAMDRASHEQYFPIATGSTHEEAACSQCHTGSSYSEYSCIDCHEHAKDKMDPEHSGVTGYVYASSNCLGCHPDGKAMTRAQHDAWFIITTGDHSRYDCDDCHKDPSSYSIYTCINCHDGEHTCSKMDAEHREEGVRNYKCEDSACLSCHPKGRED